MEEAYHPPRRKYPHPIQLGGGMMGTKSGWGTVTGTPPPRVGRQTDTCQNITLSIPSESGR